MSTKDTTVSIAGLRGAPAAERNIKSLPGAPRRVAIGDRAWFRDPARIQASHSTVLDSEKLRAAGLLAPPEMRNLHMGQYRAIRRVIADHAFDESSPDPRQRFVVVTSSLSGEGKTFTSFNLAQSLARERDFAVLLIDADLPKRDLTQRLGLESSRGFSDWLVSETVPVEDFIVSTETPRLFLLPAGQSFTEASDLLGGALFDQLIESLLARYPALIVVCDAGPLLLSAEAEIMAREAGHLLLVVRSGSTERDTVREAVSLIDSKQKLSLILNAWEPTGFGDPIYYGQEYYQPAANPPA